MSNIYFHSNVELLELDTAAGTSLVFRVNELRELFWRLEKLGSSRMS